MSRRQNIFKQGSTTFYTSSLFFPHKIRTDVTDLYNFVRIADDYVDQLPADTDGFYRLRRLWEAAADSVQDSTDGRIIKNMQRISRKHNFDSSWTDYFLDAMQSDLASREDRTLNDSLRYVHGSAEVIGLMMARIMKLPREADHAAAMQGRALQWINFVRDIAEDNQLGRQYFPEEDLKKFNLPDLSEKTARYHSEDFAKFVRFQINRYKNWQAEAEQGYEYIPRRLLISLRTASTMYGWTAQKIADNPLIVFEKKVKPSKVRVFMTAIKVIFQKHR